MAQGAPYPKDIAAFTILRGLAAWWVVFYHVRENFMIYWPQSFAALVDKGYLAVDFFFLLSGFVIQLNYGDKIKGQAPQLWDFWIKRAARIYPLHLLSLGLVILYALALVISGRPLTANYDLSHLWMQFLLMHNWGFSDHLAWNVPSWSISTEWGAYIFFPLWALMGQWHKRPTLLLLLIVTLLAAGLYFLYAARGFSFLGKDIMHLGLWRCLAQFAMGSLLCILWQRHGQNRISAYGAVFFALMMAGLAHYFSWPETAWLPLFFTFCLYGAACFSAKLGRNSFTRALIFLGDSSYATYLLHFVVFIYWKALFWSGTGSAPLWHLPLYVLLVLAISVITYVYFEKPAQRWVWARWSARKNLPLVSKNPGQA